MLKSKQEKSIIEFIKHIEILASQSSSSERILDGFREEETERSYITKILSDTTEMLDHNEWGVALEMLLDNLYEIDFVLDAKAIELAKAAIEKSGLDYENWKFIEELKK